SRSPARSKSVAARLRSLIRSTCSTEHTRAVEMKVSGSTSNGERATKGPGSLAMRRIAILGAGGMGTALALLMARSGADIQVVLWCRDPEHAGQIARSRVNVSHLPDVEIPDSIEITDNAASAVGVTDLIVAAIPTSYLRDALTRIAGAVPKQVPVLS